MCGQLRPAHFPCERAVASAQTAKPALLGQGTVTMRSMDVTGTDGSRFTFLADWFQKSVKLSRMDVGCRN